ncbi:uncharacterized protein LOC120328924 [Styela clava]
MKISFVVFAVSLAACCKFTEGCSRRNAINFDQDLANFMGNCPQLRQASSGILPSLRSVVVYVLRDSVWYKRIRERVCAGIYDVASCWINAIPILLKDDSPFETPLAQCICDWDGTCWAPEVRPRKMKSIGSDEKHGEIKIKKKSFSTCLVQNVQVSTSQFPSWNGFDINSVSIFLQNHYSYCRTVPTIPQEQWCLVPMLYVDTFCEKESPESDWRDDLVEVYKLATRSDVYLRKIINTCDSTITEPRPSITKPETTSTSSDCKAPGVLMRCKSKCPATCAEKPFPCSVQCTSEYTCGCPTGYIQLSLENKECVKEGACPRNCENGKIYQLCPSMCQPTCANRNPVGCQRGCNFKKCVCPSGMVKPDEKSDRCIRPSQCLPQPPVSGDAYWTDWSPITQCEASCGPNLFREEIRRCRFPDGRSAPVILCGDAKASTQRFVPCGPTQCPTTYVWTQWKCRRMGGLCRDTRSCWFNVGGDKYQQVRPQSKCGQTERPNPSCTGC